MDKKYLSLGLAAAVLVALFAMALHDPLRFPVINRVVTAVITPFAAASSAVGGWVDDTGEAMTTVKTLQQQNESLQSEINELRYANLAMAEIYAENQRLREMLNYKKSHPEQRLVVSKVLGRTPGELSDSLYIDKGTDDGVQQDMAVVTVNGLVGLVDEAYPSSARVTLVTSTRCNVPLLMEDLQREADVLPGDVVVTSGYSQNHPAGIVIGTVKESSLDAAGLLRNATVEPAAVREGLEEVFVVVWHQQDGNVK